MTSNFFIICPTLCTNKFRWCYTLPEKILLFYVRYIDHVSPIKNWDELERDFSFGKTPDKFDFIQILYGILLTLC